VHEEPPEQHWLASLDPLDTPPADSNNPNVDTPVNASKANNLDMILILRCW